MPAFPDGVWLVDLVPVTSASFVPRAVAGALGVDEAPGRDLSETLIRATSSRRLLLLLDNCEHVMDACARLIDDLLRAAPHVRVLATSQEAIGMGGETVRPVAPLPTPGSRRRTTWRASASTTPSSSSWSGPGPPAPDSP